MNKPNVLNGLVLTGGRSTRMGQDKSQLIYHEKPQREHLTDLLRPFCDAVFWSVNVGQAAELSSTEQPLIVDAFDIPGPLNGILSAFRHDPKAAWLVVACDMPLLTETSLTALVNGRDAAKPATSFYDSNGQFPEPLLSIWEPTMEPILQTALASGYYAPRPILMLADCHLLTIPDVRELLNVNKPAEQKALKHRG
ncbi:NTP transferase domain-containing protein [Spirosoma spitsbergense]|uniref:NTP transferase domain-containing protein n=1 Tax=Spirosoma spitsbergense TaxID=431554 RepID=UPI000380F275|nr:NTP transferase domain-containing protein [Spirosoma spitsbergense]